MSESSRIGSTAPVLTLPAVPTTSIGRSPRARSSAICVRSASGLRRCAASVGIQRIASVPRPNRSHAFWIQVWVPAEAYTRSGAPAAARPPARTASPSIARRPARKQTKLAMLPPLTSSPPQVWG